MLDEDQPGTSNAETPAEPAKPVVKKTTRKAAKRPAKKVAAAPAAETPTEAPAPVEQAEKPVVRKTTRRAPAKKTAATTPDSAPSAEAPAAETSPAESPAAEAPAAKKTAAKRTTRKVPAKKVASSAQADTAQADEAQADTAQADAAPAGIGAVLFQTPDATKVPARRTRKAAAPKTAAPKAESPASTVVDEPVDEDTDESAETSATAEPAAAKKTGSRRGGGRSGASARTDTVEGADEDAEDVESAEGDEDESGDAEGGATRRRRRRGGRRRRKSGEDATTGNEESSDSEESTDAADSDTGDASDSGDESNADGETGESSTRRRRRRRRAGEEGGERSDEDANTVTRVRRARSAEDQITAISGSTRLEAKKQRRREGREAGRRRAPIVSEAEFLARREAVERVMVIRQREDLTQIAVLEDKVLVEHYVARESQTSLIGNIYLGRVQNVLPSMEAAFIDIGKGRNAVLYAGEVNWSALGHKDGQPRKIESVLQSGQPVLVQVTKDPVGHKGARLTSQISLAGRFLVYVPDGTTSGISRKLPDTERNRLKALLKELVPDTAGVIVRTAAEGASEEELTRDVERLKARWEDVEKKAANKNANAQLLYGEPDLTLKVVRDLFTEDFTKLVIEGEDAWNTVNDYVAHVAPDLAERLERFEPGPQDKDAFAVHRIEEQIHKGLDRKVWLPSGGSLVIDRTEAMTVVDVNTGKFTGSGGNLEETVTKNNLEAAEEIVRQLRLRDIGGIIVVDFIDMVLESNRDLVVRRLVECLGRDRTRHQVAEVTSLGLIQMTRKRIGTGLLEAFSENCEHCHGRGVVIKDSPVEPSKADDDNRRSSRKRGGRREGGDEGSETSGSTTSTKGSSGRGRGGRGGAEKASADSVAATPSPKDVAAMARHEKHDDDESAPADATPAVVDAPAVVVEAPPAQDAPAAKGEAVTPEPDAEPAAEPTKPAVITRTRRRSASRPAGPPAAALAEPGNA